MISHHMDSNSRTLVIAFSSQPHRFEWDGFLSRINVKYILASDETDNWYQDGISGIGSNWDVLDWLNRIQHRVVLLGLSAGAYPALLYNYYSTPARVIAISPVTGSGKLSDFGPEWIQRLNGRPNFRPVTDLKCLYETSSNMLRITDRIMAVVSDGEGTELDTQMCMRIGVKPFVHSGFSHVSLAKKLCISGQLEEWIKRP